MPYLDYTAYESYSKERRRYRFENIACVANGRPVVSLGSWIEADVNDVLVTIHTWSFIQTSNFHFLFSHSEISMTF